MSAVKNLFFLMLLIIIPSCTTLHNKLMHAEPGLTKQEVLAMFGSPDETDYDTNFTYWVYHSSTSSSQQGKARLWKIRYAFQGNTLMEVNPEMVPTPQELQVIENSNSPTRLQNQDEAQPMEKAKETDSSFKEL